MEDNIRTDLCDIEWEFGQGPFASSCEHGNATSVSINDRKFLDWKTVSFSRRTLFHEIS